MEAKNIKEFQALVERYESITLKEIKKNWQPVEWGGYEIANILTGFHNTSTCTLCLATKTRRKDYDCNRCVYGGLEQCHFASNRESYGAIFDSMTPKQLFYAYRARAKHLRKTYPQYLK